MNLQTVQQLFPEAVENRGKVWLQGQTVDRLIDDFPVSFSRRRYGGTTYTWAEAFIAGQWVSLGDPFPCVNPPTKALREEIKRRAPQVVYEQLLTGGAS